MSLDKLRELVAAAAKATPGPVYTVVNSHDKSVNIAVVEKDYQVGPYIALLKITDACRSREDAAFIEACYNTIPDLESLLSRHEALKAAMRQKAKEWREQAKGVIGSAVTGECCHATCAAELEALAEDK